VRKDKAAVTELLVAVANPGVQIYPKLGKLRLTEPRAATEKQPK
jgi:hypothetical protein